MHDPSNHDAPAPEQGRRSYEPPQVLETAEFETLALECGKTTPSVPTCNALGGGTLTGS